MLKAALLSVFVAATVVSTSISATVLLPADLGQLSREARSIIRGLVTDVETRWADDHRRIETLVTIAPDAYLKGPLGETVVFSVPGGRLGRYRSVVVGAPEFSTGQRVIVFLGRRDPGIPYVLGWAQGVFRVGDSPNGLMVTPPPILPTGGSSSIVRGDPLRVPVPLAEFERQVRALAGGAQ
jgi:hypothetical protein